MRLAECLVLGAMLRHESRLALITQKAGRYRHGTAGIQDVDHRLAIVRRDLDGGVRPAGGRSTDEQRQLETLALHLARHMHHFVERRSDQTAQPDHVRLLRLGAFENFFARDHHTHVDDFVVVAGKNDADDVLADVVNVTL